MLRFTILFVVIALGLITLEILQPVEDAVINPFSGVLAKVSVFIIQLWDDNVISYGRVIESTINPFAISIERVCNGIEAVILLFSAILAFPAPWKHKIIGLIIGFFAIQGLNIVRIISLFYLGQWNETAFKWFHLYLWQALIILDALVVWLVWLRMLPRPAGSDADSSGDSELNLNEAEPDAG